MEELPLRPGSHGEAVADLQRRLLAAGHDVGLDELGDFSSGTESAVASFQDRRGISIDGECGPQTWQELVEASWRLGDRNLYLRRPMLRGDDVEDLQRRLAALGFHTDRIDGIFGPRSQDAVQDFQRNAGLTVDGIFGSDGLDALNRLGNRTEAHAVTAMAERIKLAGRELSIPRLALGHNGTAAVFIGAIERRCRQRGVASVALHHSSPSWRAAAANRFGAEAYLDIRPSSASVFKLTHFKSSDGNPSAGGDALGHHLAERLSTLTSLAPTREGNRLPVLRETSMPAVILRLGPLADLVGKTADLADSIVAGLDDWSRAPTL